MMTRFPFLIAAAVALAAAPTFAADDTAVADAMLAKRAHFAAEVLPLLETKCLGCHGAGDSFEEPEGNLSLLSREAMIAGGDTAAALVPGDHAASALWLVTDREVEDWSTMPPQERNALTDAERDVLKRWIDDGAVWVETDEIAETLAAARAMGTDGDEWSSGGAGGIVMPTLGGLSPTWDNRAYAPEDIWAYQPIADPEVPAVDDASHPIDAFLLDAIRGEQITTDDGPVTGYAPPAEAATLLRRLTIDLHGLPPSPDQIAAAKRDETTGGFDYEAAVDAALADPKYGEQLGRLWLDVVRYADTAGFANDYERPNAWRYRDYVIRSLNDDKPYDEFIVEQIAGDELDSSDPENLIATGFLRMGPWEHTAMSVAAVTRQQFLDDVVQSVGVSFLGQGMRCCKCHDHKFDPLPTRDYYRMQAVFAPVQFADRDVDYLPEENTEGFADSERRFKRVNDVAWERVQVYFRKQEAAKKAWLKEHGYKAMKDVPQAERPQMDIGLSDEEISMKKVLMKQLHYVARQKNRVQPLAYSVYSGPPRPVDSNKPLHKMPAPDKLAGDPETIRILTGGSIEAPSDEVAPGVISAMAGSNAAVSPSDWNTIPDDAGSRRLAFARWIASPQNTLTARVIVNRLWQRHFGTGLVATPNNFGATGSKPTHPALLDWLASRLIDAGWSLKAIDRLIVTSDAYRQASSRPDLAAIRMADPRNDLLTVFPVRRLAAEEMRDALLAITGELNPEMGGLGVFPELNWEVALQPRHIMGSLAPAWIPDPTPSQRHRRAVYHFRVRGMADPLLETFNKPGSDISCERRDETTVATQAFALFNSEFAQSRAVALAASVAASHETAEERIEATFRRVLLREPTEAERTAAMRHVDAMTAQHAAADPLRRDPPKTVRRGMVEEMTGTHVEWEEELVGMDEFEPDDQLADLPPDERALADLALVLMNTNEFVYVR